MGIAYLLNRDDFNFNEKLINKLVLLETLSNEESEQFIELQSRLNNEIAEPISILNKDSLTQKNSKRSKGLIFCLAKMDSKIVGYGYGYISDVESIFYLDTIGVDSEYRNKKLGTEIKVKLIKYGFDIPEIKQIKAVTQEFNCATIRINKKLGFKLKTK